MPMFIKEGAVLPKYPVQQYVGEKKFDEITLDVYYKKGKETSKLYYELKILILPFGYHYRSSYQSENVIT